MSSEVYKYFTLEIIDMEGLKIIQSIDHAVQRAATRGDIDAGQQAVYSNEIRPELIRSDVRHETHQELAARLRGQTIIQVADHLLGGRIE